MTDRTSLTNTVVELRRAANSIFTAADQPVAGELSKLLVQAAEEIERLDADAAGVQAELESVRQERHQLRNELTAARLENQQRRALLVEVYNHGENSELHGRIGAALGAAPGEDASPAEPYFPAGARQVTLAEMKERYPSSEPSERQPMAWIGWPQGETPSHMDLVYDGSTRIPGYRYRPIWRPEDHPDAVRAESKSSEHHCPTCACPDMRRAGFTE